MALCDLLVAVVRVSGAAFWVVLLNQVYCECPERDYDGALGLWLSFAHEQASDGSDQTVRVVFVVAVWARRSTRWLLCAEWMVVLARRESLLSRRWSFVICW